MKYITLFEVNRATFSIIHILMILICVFLFAYVFYSFKNKVSMVDKCLSMIVLTIFVLITSATIVSSNVTSIKMFSALQDNKCSVVEGDVACFHTPTILGHDTESFYINDVYFEYSNSVEIGYSKTKALGGCVRGDGQNLRVSYVTIDDRNIILRIEEEVVI